MTEKKPLIRAIGILESCFREKFGAPRQPQLVPSSTAKLKIFKQFIPEQSLVGLSEFSHVWLLPYFHLNTNKQFKSTVHPPRLKGDTVGVFASRSPHRPSPVGLSLVRLDRVEKDTLYFSEIDLVDGTPILDIKPFIPSYDVAENVRAGWTERAASTAFSVSFADSALAELAKLEKYDAPRARALIQDTLSHDLRNPRDKAQLADGKPLAVFLLDLEVAFKVRGQAVEVTAVTRAQAHKKAKPVEVPRELL